MLIDYRLLGSEGKSYSFDSRASGYGRGEGIATVILKSLPDAVRDGDPIRAVIRETALNQDGKTVTITSPSKNAQEDLIRMCYRNAGLDPSDTTYVEAHGTGTRTGDPIEAGAIGSVLGQDRMPGKPLLMGSVKSNIGHLEAASGLASVIKVALALENGSIPPSINFKEPNPAIPLDKWNLKIPTKLEPWPSDQAKRASLSNFGYGGTNAHVIMEDTASFLRGWSDKAGQRTDKSVGNATHKNGYSLIGYANGVHDITKNGMNGHIPDDDSMKGDSEKVHITISAKLSLQPSWRIFMLSGKDERATQSLISNLWEHLQVKGQDLDFQDLAYTLGQRRSIFPWLAAAPARNIDELSATLSETSFKSTHSTSVPRIGFAFTGQGAQWFAMGKELLGAYPVFEESIREAEKHLRSFGAEFSLLSTWLKMLCTI